MKIAIQGELGAFSHQATLQLARGAQVLACATSAQVFDALDSRRAAAAVIPVENTLAGPVGEHLDLLLERDVFVHAEMRLRIEHNLIAAPGVKLKDIRQVLSHPVALDQCRNFFRRRRGISAVPFYDTAGSVKHILANGLQDAAAVASRQAAKEYGGKVLMSGLEDNKQNFTRFFLIDKSKIESRPVRGKPWEYRFYVDVLRGDDPAMRLALKHLEEIAGFVKVLGVDRRAK